MRGGRAAGWLWSTSEQLAERHRWYAVLLEALVDFRRNKLRYHTYFFTVNAFVGVLALFLAISSLMGFLGDSEFKRQVVDGMTSVMPVLRGSSSEVHNIFETFKGAAGIVSFLFLIWAATRIFSALETGFNIIWDSEKRRYAHSLLVGLLMTAVVGALFLLTSLIQFGFNRLLGELLETRNVGYYLGVAVAKPIIGLLINFLLFLFVYRVVTGVSPPFTRCLPAAALAAVLFLGSQYVLNLYFDYIYKVPAIYGSLASGIILILWMQATGMITFYGAEVIHALE